MRKVAACSVRYFLPGTIWFPVLTRHYPPLPMRLRTAAESVPREKYKSELNMEDAGDRAFSRGERSPTGHRGPGSRSASRFAQEFSGFLVDEMKPGAGEADDGPVRIGPVLRRGLRKPMLHVHAQPWTFEKDMPAHPGEYAELARRVTSVCLRSSGRRKASGRCILKVVRRLIYYL